MLYFPDVKLSYGSDANTECKVLKADFGDGYSLATVDGLNSIRSTYKAVFDDITASEADLIEGFLIARGGYEAFLFRPPRTNKTLKWRCAKWQRTPNNKGLWNIECTFEQAFVL